MRIQIHIDGAPTEMVRDLAAALSRVELRGTLMVGCDGPEKWSATTPRMTPAQHAIVVAAITDVHGRLEYLRQELRAERISYSELAELQSLAPHIDRGDVELLEAAAVPEH